MSDELTKKLEDLTEVDLKKVVGGKGNNDNSITTEEYCDTCGMVTLHRDGVCVACDTSSYVNLCYR